ncbi:MAG: hypothetical protein O3C39_04625 [Planctomycetota bacterium]|jgi:folate-binding protein YgfZ|nr:hypothetical protein [Acidimicrobiales bacterium]MDA0254821.1 hypothetical protein [Planctomycetota bacterium]MDA1200949.1 hypothetical protein [Planctomycetota bacterium]
MTDPSRSDPPPALGGRPAVASGVPAAGFWATLPLEVVTATGGDAARFVDNFTTAAVSSLEPGQGGETFFTDAKGWVIALATVLRTPDGLVLVTAAGQGQHLRDHLEHYHIREAVEIDHRPGATATLLVSGAAAAEAVASLTGGPPPADAFGHQSASINATAVRVVRVEGQGCDGFWIQLPAEAAAAVEAGFVATGLLRADEARLEAGRILARFPTPTDVPPKTLPQELGRDSRAISFTKGCYLGQETVARLDALGHVNRRLVTLAIAADAPLTLPATVRAGDQQAGMLTSACPAAEGGSTIGLGLIHTRWLDADTLEVDGRRARVVSSADHAPGEQR